MGKKFYHLEKLYVFFYNFSRKMYSCKTFSAFFLSERGRVVRKLKQFIIWFIRLLRKDEAEYEEDQKIKKTLYRNIRGKDREKEK